MRACKNTFFLMLRYTLYDLPHRSWVPDSMRYDKGTIFESNLFLRHAGPKKPVIRSRAGAATRSGADYVMISTMSGW